jgi:hypothetical protein
MATGDKSRRLTIAGTALVLALFAAWWGYDAWSKFQTRKAAMALVNDSGKLLRDALLSANAGSSSPAAEAVAKLEAQVTAVERNYANLKQLDAAALGTLAEAGDDYILTVREIARRISVSSRSRLNLGASSRALRSHMAADRGAASWPGEAVRLRERVDRDYRDYRLAAEALVKLLDSLPASQMKVASGLDPSLIIAPPAIASARERVLEDAKRMTAEIEKLTNLAGYR